MTRAQEIAAGLAEVRERIARAEQAAGRAAGSVRLIAVSKKMPPDDLRAALAAGQVDLGESYGQELRDKRQLLAAEAVPPRWHFI
ncbi:MAG TPA: YggS family pyridoxal phosphate-dependent enzyme, partial [Polyangia bacterium]|nr:YggS family pyridoxal phosphate-dependent enzyme [Polyangia bacterium]